MLNVNGSEDCIVDQKQTDGAQPKPKESASEIEQIKAQKELLIESIKSGIMQLTMNGNKDKNLATIREEFAGGNNKRIADYQDYLENQSSGYLDV